MGTYFEKYGQTIITLAAIAAAFVGLVTIVGNRFDAQDRFNIRLFELLNQRPNPQDQHLDAQNRLANERFEAVTQRLDRLTTEVSELRRLVVGIGERVSRNEGEIDVIREQLRIADTPSP